MLSFETDLSQQEISSVTIPEGSNFIKAKILHDGIYLFFEIPGDDESLPMVKESYYILKPKQEVPKNSRFVDLLDTIIETKDGQGMILFPIYKII